MKALNKKITKGVGWTSVATFGKQGLRLLLKLVLAKLLLPEHYGLIGMAMVFISFITLISELGMGAALIQKPEEQMNERYYSTAFWINLIVSIAGFMIITVAVAPAAAWFYDEEMLVKLIPVLAIPVILDSLYLIPKVKLSRALNFRPQAIREIVSVLIAGTISIYLAIQGFGVWSLAFNGIIASVVSIILYYYHVDWKPQLIFDKEAFYSLFGFGGYVMVENIFSFFTSNIDYILIGKLIGSSALGVYTLAFILTDTFRKQFLNILSKVLYPAYSSIQHDIQQLKKYFLTVIRINGLVLFPIMTTFVVLAEPIILVGFGEEWRNTVFPLRMLALAVIVHVLGGTVATIMRSIGRADLIMKLNIFTTIFITVPAISLGAVFYGINGVAVGVLVNKVLSYLVSQKYVYQELQLTIWTVLKQFAGLGTACTIIGLTVFGMQYLLDMPRLTYLISGVGVMLGLYFVYLRLFEMAMIEKILKLISNKSGKSFKSKMAVSNK